MIMAYECDPATADAEFLLSKAKYKAITGRQQKQDVLYYQIRQSFPPGEIDAETSFDDEVMTGVITVINTARREVKLSRGEDDFSWIKLEDIVSTS
ncbi:hypothetical protein D1872_188560 [compost metagenome]